MPNQGLLIGGAFADALNQALKTYREEKRFGEDLKLRKKEMAADLYSKGLIDGSEEPEGNGLLSDDKSGSMRGRYVGDGLYEFASNKNKAVAKVLNKLYPGSFDESDLADLRPNDISNVFKAQRLKESTEERRQLEKEKQKYKRESISLRSNKRTLNPGDYTAGRDPQEDWEPIAGGVAYSPNAVERFQQRLEKQSAGLSEVIRGASTIDRFTDLAKTNPMAAAGLPVLLARAIGEKGPLSNFDVQMWGGSKAVISRLNRAASMMKDGLLPKEDIGFIKELGTALNESAKQRLSAIEEDMAGKYSAAYGGGRDASHFLLTGKKRGLIEDKKSKPSWAE